MRQQNTFPDRKYSWWHLHPGILELPHAGAYPKQTEERGIYRERLEADTLNEKLPRRRRESYVDRSEVRGFPGRSY